MSEAEPGSFLLNPNPQPPDEYQDHLERLRRLVHARVGVVPDETYWERAHMLAHALLREHLTPAQRKELTERNFFTIRGSNGGIYRIYNRLTFNIHEMRESKLHRDRILIHVQSWCAIPKNRCPMPDVMFAQKLMIESDEPSFRQIANHMVPGATTLS